MYTKAKLVDQGGNEKSILTFGPLSVLPEFQRKGYGKKLLEYSFKKAAEEFDKAFEKLEKEYRKSQELFYIHSHSRVF